MPIPDPRRPGSGQTLRLRGVRVHNLRDVDLRVPLGTFVAITGVWGPGNSTLVTKAPARERRVPREQVGAYDSLTGAEHIDKIIEIDQSPIGRTPRSNPATYTGLFGTIRELFAGVPEARIRGYRPGRFSFNVKGGRCENCKGDGILKIEMQFLPDVYVPCEVCKGKRYNREALEIHYKGKSIADVLEMTIEEALEFFGPVPSVRAKLQTLFDVGLGYVHLGQPATTLSGGEAQRVKLSTELSRRATGRTLYVLDEPTTGLHFADVEKLLQVLHRLVDTGNTVVVIEHNLDVIKTADWIVDLGPGGGARGGRIIAEGTPEQVASAPDSATGEYLARVLRGEPLVPLSDVTFAEEARRTRAQQYLDDGRDLERRARGPVVSLAPIAYARASAAMRRAGMLVWAARWSAPVVSIVYATALLVIAVSYSASRTEASWAQPVFWAGFLLLLIPSVALLTSSSGSRNQRIAVLTLLGLSFYGMKILYSPIGFTLADELQHWRTATDILKTGHLFGLNPILPVSPYYPGLESVTTAVVSVTGLSVFHAGVLVIGTARLVFILGLFVVYEIVGSSSRLASVSVLIYMGNPHFAFFDSQFAYESLGLALAVLAVFAIARRLRLFSSGRRDSPVIEILAAAAVTVTHHLTSYALALLVTAWTLAIRFWPGWSRHRSPQRIAILLLVMVGAWTALAGNLAIPYFAEPVGNGVLQLLQLITGTAPPRELFESADAPPWVRLASIGSVALVALALPLGIYAVWRRGGINPPAIALAVLACLYPPLQALRFTDFGLTVANRSAPFLFLGVGFLVALAALRLDPKVRSGPVRRTVVIASTASIIAGSMAATIAAWRLPGPYIDGIYTRTSDPQGIVVADWARDVLGSGHRFGADIPDSVLMGSYGDQRPITDQADHVFWKPAILEASGLGLDQKNLIRQTGIEYFVIDRRDGNTLVVSGVGRPTTTSFDGLDHVGRILDSGDVVIYDVRRLP